MQTGNIANLLPFIFFGNFKCQEYHSVLNQVSKGQMIS